MDKEKYLHSRFGIASYAGFENSRRRAREVIWGPGKANIRGF